MSSRSSGAARGDQRALARERVAPRAARKGAIAGRARGEEGRGWARQETRLWVLVFRLLFLLLPTGFNRVQLCEPMSKTQPTLVPCASAA